MKYLYGMKFRGFSPGAQPMEGFLERRDDTTGIYFDILVYSRELTGRERYDYDLKFLGVEE